MPWLSQIHKATFSFFDVLGKNSTWTAFCQFVLSQQIKTAEDGICHKLPEAK